MELFEAIEKRRSIRSYRPDPVPRELIEKLITAASQAPSVMNEQPWQFFVTTGQTREKVGAIMARSTIHLEEFMDVLGTEGYAYAVEWYSELGHAPAVIVCAMPRDPTEPWATNRHLSIGAAIQNLLLAATAVGLGACYITFSLFVSEELAEVLELPEDLTTIGIVALGFPASDQPVPPPRSLDSAVYLD